MALAGTGVYDVQAATGPSVGESDPDGVLRVAYFMERLSLEINAERGEIYGIASTHLGALEYTIGTPFVLGRDGTFEPFLAEGYEIIDPTTVEVTLRDGLTFHDGTPYTAEVLADTLREYQGLDTTAFAATALPDVESIDVTGDTTLTFRLSEPVAGLVPSLLAGPAGFVVSPASDPPNTVYGAGPFEIVDFVLGDHLTVEKFEDFWDADSYPLGGIEFVNLPAIEAAQNALEAGQVDLVATNPRDVDSLLQRGSFASVVTQNQAAYMLPLCETAPPFDDPLFREAFDLAINREQIAEVVFGGIAEPLESLWYPGAPLAVDGLIDPDGDQDRARELLDQIGWDEDTEIPFGVFPGFQTQQVIAETIAGQVAQVGIRLNIVTYEGYEVAPFVNPETGGLHVLVNYFPGVQAVTAPAIGATLAYSPCETSKPDLLELAAPIVAGDLSDTELTEAWTELQRTVTETRPWYMLVTQPAVYVYNSERVQGLQPGTVGLAGATAPAPFLEGVSIRAEG